MILALAIATAPLAASQEEQRRLTLSDIAAMAICITGFGPTDTHYIDAAADPRRP